MIRSRRSIGARFGGLGGVTLIEIMVVMIVLAAAMGILIPFAVGLKDSADPVLTQQAIDLAQGELEQVVAFKRANGFGAIPTGAAACLVSMPSGFSCSRSICYVPAANLNDITACGTATPFKRVAVTVTHAEIGPVTDATLVADY